MRAHKPGQSALLLLDVVDILLRHAKVDYAVIGAIAASVHGAVRSSMDADVVLSLAAAEAGKLEANFKRAGFATKLSRGDVEDPIPALLEVCDALGNRVDLLIGLRGMEREAFARTIEVPFQGKTLRFIGKEDFIAMKVFAGGAQDIVDASRALQAGGNSIDLALLERLARGYGRHAASTFERLIAGVQT